MNEAASAAKYLKKRYCEWTADPLKPGEKFRQPYMRWTDMGARAAYWLLLDLWRLPHEA